MSQNELQAWTTAGQWLSAIGTVAAVIVALFGNWLRAKVSPPVLWLALENPDGVKTPVNLTAPDGTVRVESDRWYHARIFNRRRWSPATDVQVFLLKVEEPDPIGINRVVWIGEVPIHWRHQEMSPIARKVGHAYDCDLCSVIRGKWVAIHPLLRPTALEIERRGSCRFTVTVQARSVEADSNLLRVEIAWDGQWSDDTEEMRRHMTVREISSVAA